MSDKGIKEECLLALNEIEDASGILSSKEITDDIAYFRERLNDGEFRIAVVGEFSSGKSTFLNALLGQDVLSHGNTETTATITRIVNTNQNDPHCNTGIIHLSTGEKKPFNDFSFIREYTTTSSSQYKVVDDVEFVELYVPVFQSSRRIVFVDTPGLNGTADGHRSRTIDLVRQAHACIYLLQRHGLSDSDILFLKYLIQIQKNYIFIQNFIDDFQADEGDSVKNKIEEQRKILNERVFADHPDVSFEICGISALLALAAKDESITKLYRSDIGTITCDQRKSFYSRSCFNDLICILQSKFSDDSLEAIQYGDTCKAICSWLASLSERILLREQFAKEAYEASGEHRSVERLERLKERTIANIDKHRQKLSNLIGSELSKIRKNSGETLSKSLEDEYHTLNIEISAIKHLDALKKYESNISARVKSDVAAIISTHFKRLDINANLVYRTILLRIEEYVGINADEVQLDNLNITHQVEQHTFFQIESDIDRLKKDIASENDAVDKACRALTAVRSALRETQSKTEGMRSEISQNQAFRDSSIRRLGQRPQAVSKTRTVTKTYYRGGLGILDMIFGPKTENKLEHYQDDSAGQEWDTKRQKLENEYVLRQEHLKRELSRLIQHERDLAAQVQDADEEYNREQIRLNKKKTALEEKLDLLEAEKIHASQELLKKQKANLLEQIRHFLYDGEESILEKTIKETENDVSIMQKGIEQHALDAYSLAVEKKLARIEQMKSEQSPELLEEYNRLSTLCELITDMQNRLTGIV